MTEQIRSLRDRVKLGRTELAVSRIGLAASYGVRAAAVEEAYHDYGINLLYWGSRRRGSFGEGIRRLARHRREDLVVVVQSYARLAGWMRSSFEGALKKLGLDYADILLLGLHNRLPSERILDAALDLRRLGRTRYLAVSCHRRATFRTYVADGRFDALMFRYNAVHRGAETEVLPVFPETGRPGTIAYTATRWGYLLNPGKIPKGEPAPRGSDCYRFVLSQPLIDVCLAGPANTEEMREALATLDRGPMNEKELAWMRRIGDHIHARVRYGR